MSVIRTSVSLGQRLIFGGYRDPSMGPDQQLFSVGDFLLVVGINDDGGMQCFMTDAEGRITSHEGDTVFPEEVLILSYCRPMVRLAGHRIQKV